MTERKPQNISWEGFVEHQIQDAQRSGSFEKIPGTGQPIPGIDAPLEENWWIKRKLRDENSSVLPPLLQARQDIEQTRKEVLTIGSESLVRRRLEKLQQRVREAIYSPLPSPPVVVMPIDVEEELQRWRKSRAGNSSST